MTFSSVRAFLLGLSTPVFVLLMTALTFVVVLPLDLIVDAIVPSSGREPQYMDKYPLPGRVLISVVIFPPIETALAQWAPIMLCTRRLGMSATKAGLISALFFGLMHYYSAIYVAFTFVVGLLLSWTFFLAIERKESPFWVVTAVHALRNAVTEVLLELGIEG
jgi:hypothetical protein